MTFLGVGEESPESSQGPLMNLRGAPRAHAETVGHLPKSQTSVVVKAKQQSGPRRKAKTRLVEAFESLSLNQTLKSQGRGLRPGSDPGAFGVLVFVGGRQESFEAEEPTGAGLPRQAKIGAQIEMEASQEFGRGGGPSQVGQESINGVIQDGLTATRGAKAVKLGAQAVQNGPPDANLSVGLELDPPAGIKPVGGLDQAEGPPSDEVAELDRGGQTLMELPSNLADQRQGPMNPEVALREAGLIELGPPGAMSGVRNGARPVERRFHRGRRVRTRLRDESRPASRAG